MEEIALGTANNWCRGTIVWNLMLDSDLGPVSPSDGSCKTCYGAVDIDNTNYSKLSVIPIITLSGTCLQS